MWERSLCSIRFVPKAFRIPSPVRIATEPTPSSAANIDIRHFDIMAAGSFKADLLTNGLPWSKSLIQFHRLIQVWATKLFRVELRLLDVNRQAIDVRRSGPFTL